MEGAVVHSLLETCSRSWWASYHEWTFMAYCSFYCLCDPPSVHPDTHVINYYGTCLHVRGFYFGILFFVINFTFLFTAPYTNFKNSFLGRVEQGDFTHTLTHAWTCIYVHIHVRARVHACARAHTHTHTNTHFL